MNQPIVKESTTDKLENVSFPDGSEFRQQRPRDSFFQFHSSELANYPEGTVNRSWYAARDAQLIGYLSSPQEKITEQPRAIINLGGSEGGISTRYGDYFARHGFVSFTIGYHQGDKCWLWPERPESDSKLLEILPKDLARINLDELESAIKWFRNHELVNGQKVILSGASRGGELALILASMFPEHFSHVVALVPSTRVVRANSWNKERWPQFVAEATPAWVLPDGSPYEGEEGPLVFTNGKESPFIRGLIPVTKIKAPIFALSGIGDDVWPQCEKDKDLVLQSSAEKWSCASSVTAPRMNSNDRTKVLPNVGHSCMPPGLFDYRSNGSTTVEEITRLLTGAWEEIHTFLKTEGYRA
jgi:pimeloyl-ACP methyl ester carboxylesterase